MKHGQPSSRETSLEIPNRVTFLDGNGELPMLEVNTSSSRAEIYLHGAHVTHFQRKGEEPVLFLSKVSRFETNHAIRGGIPVILPWFGPREGEPSHGFARLKTWTLRDITPLPDGSIAVRLRLPESPESAILPPFHADYKVTVSDALMLQLTLTNYAPDMDFTFESCLHTYFAVGDIGAVSIKGLKGARYLDKCANFKSQTEKAETLKIDREVDRVYTDTTATVEIIDEKLNRKIVVEKDGSASTIVWNPWIAKSQQMPDFGNDEYLRMVCVESGNVGQNKIALKPGEKSVMTVKISTVKL